MRCLLCLVIDEFEFWDSFQLPLICLYSRKAACKQNLLRLDPIFFKKRCVSIFNILVPLPTPSLNGWNNDYWAPKSTLNSGVWFEKSYENEYQAGLSLVTQLHWKVTKNIEVLSLRCMKLNQEILSNLVKIEGNIPHYGNGYERMNIGQH